MLYQSHEFPGEEHFCNLSGQARHQYMANARQRAHEARTIEIKRLASLMLILVRRLLTKNTRLSAKSAYPYAEVKPT